MTKYAQDIINSFVIITCVIIIIIYKTYTKRIILLANLRHTFLYNTSITLKKLHIKKKMLTKHFLYSLKNKKNTWKQEVVTK